MDLLIIALLLVACTLLAFIIDKLAHINHELVEIRKEMGVE